MDSISFLRVVNYAYPNLLPIQAFAIKFRTVSQFVDKK